MTTKTKSSYVFCPDKWQYVQDTNSTILVHTTDQKTYTLHGFESSIWSWLTLNYSYRKLVKLLTALLEVSEEDAIVRLQAILLKWVEIGIVSWDIVNND